MSDKPEFDFTRFSWRDAKAITRLQARAARVAALLETKEALLDRAAFDSALDEQDAIFEELQGYITRVLVSVPADWLVPNAPDALDWTDPTSLDWLRGSAFGQLQTMMAEASKPEAVSGN